MYSSGTGLLVFINDETYDGSSRIKSEIYRNIVCHFTENASNLIVRNFIMPQHNDLNQTGGKSGNYFKLVMSVTVLTEQVFYLKRDTNLKKLH